MIQEREKALWADGCALPEAYGLQVNRMGHGAEALREMMRAKFGDDFTAWFGGGGR